MIATTVLSLNQLGQSRILSRVLNWQPGKFPGKSGITTDTLRIPTFLDRTSLDIAFSIHIVDQYRLTRTDSDWLTRTDSDRLICVSKFRKSSDYLDFRQSPKTGSSQLLQQPLRLVKAISPSSFVQKIWLNPFWKAIWHTFPSMEIIEIPDFTKNEKYATSSWDQSQFSDSPSELPFLRSP